MTTLLIFDLDGTLLDTIEDLANSVNYALELHKLPTHKINDYRFFVGNGMNKLIERALPIAQRNSDMISMVKVDFLEHYFDHSEENTKPYKGIVELLEKLNSKGLKIAVASNKVHEATVELVNRFFPTIPFISILGQREGVATKPNAAIVESILETAKVNKSEALYIGDSGVDVATANNAKVRFVGVLWGFRPRKELEEVGATTFIENPIDLMNYIEN